MALNGALQDLTYKPRSKFCAVWPSDTCQFAHVSSDPSAGSLDQQEMRNDTAIYCCSMYYYILLMQRHVRQVNGCFAQVIRNNALAPTKALESTQCDSV